MWFRSATPAGRCRTAQLCGWGNSNSSSGASEGLWRAGLRRVLDSAFLLSSLLSVGALSQVSFGKNFLELRTQWEHQRVWEKVLGRPVVETVEARVRAGGQGGHVGLHRGFGAFLTS